MRVIFRSVGIDSKSFWRPEGEGEGEQNKGEKLEYREVALGKSDSICLRWIWASYN